MDIGNHNVTKIHGINTENTEIDLIECIIIAIFYYELYLN